MDLLLSIINESRASDKAFGLGSENNMIWYVNNFIKAAIKANKKPTYLQLKKYLDEHGYEWSKVANYFRLPPVATSARFNTGYFINHFKDKFDEVTRQADAHRDEYDELIDIFWDFHDKKSNNEDVTSILDNPKFKVLIDLFKEDPENAEKIFGKHYDRAKRWLAKYINEDFENSYEHALDEFWLWHRKVKNGDTDAKLDPEVINKLKELVKDQDKAISIIGNRGLFFFVAKKVNELYLDNEDFDTGDDAVFGESYIPRINKLKQFI